MMNYQSLFLALAFSSLVNGHMMLLNPAPLRAKNNPHSKQSAIDYSYTSPLSGPSQFPCKGYLVDMSDPSGAGASVQTYTAGAASSFSVTGGATHGGGSCQITLAYPADNFRKFTVIHSYEGSCPLSDGQEFPFTVPADAPTGRAAFVWTWYNKIGNREIYQDAAAVTIIAGTGSTPDIPFSERPDIFVANMGSCTTIEGTEVIFPDPGPDVTRMLSNTMASTMSSTIKGVCLPVNGIGNSGGSNGNAGPGVASSSLSMPPPTQATATLASSASFFTALPTSAGTTSALAAATGGVFTISMDGSCGGTVRCRTGFCCSSSNYCGNTPLHCGVGCQPIFGQCGTLPSRRGIAGRVKL